MARDTPYREHLPHPVLGDHVACYWSIRCASPTASGGDDVVVPDACMDFLFDLTGGAATVVGTMTRPLTVQRGAAMDLLGIRFRPGGIGAFLGRLPADRLTDGMIALKEVYGATAAELLSRLQETDSTVERVRRLNAALLGWFGDVSADHIVLKVARAIEVAEGRIRVEELARHAGLGRRQMERRFLAAVGIAPKAACRVLRFQGVRRRINTEPVRSLAVIALEAGYHDQAHMTRDFVALAGTPPGSWRMIQASGRDAFVQDGELRVG